MFTNFAILGASPGSLWSNIFLKPETGLNESLISQPSACRRAQATPQRIHDAPKIPTEKKNIESILVIIPLTIDISPININKPYLVGGWYTYLSEQWWSESQLGWLFHSQLNGQIIHSCSKPPSRCSLMFPIFKLVGGFNLPLWKIWVCQLGLLFPIYGKIIHMFQTTNQQTSTHQKTLRI